MFGKKGVNAVVAVVMIFLVAVVGVAVLWTGVIPVVQENAEASVVDAEVRIQTDEGYTTWYEGSDDGQVCIQVKRGSDDSLISKILAKIEISGDSYEEEFTKIPKPNSVVTECFTKPVYKTKPDSIMIYPVLDISGKEKVSSFFSEISKNIIPEASERQGEEGIGGECVPECGTNEECVEGVCECVSGYDYYEGDCYVEGSIDFFGGDGSFDSDVNWEVETMASSIGGGQLNLDYSGFTYDSVDPYLVYNGYVFENDGKEYYVKFDVVDVVGSPSFAFLFYDFSDPEENPNSMIYSDADVTKRFDSDDIGETIVLEGIMFPDFPEGGGYPEDFTQGEFFMTGEPGSGDSTGEIFIDNLEIYSGTCTPDCSGKECGDDGCGGICGSGCGATEGCYERVCYDSTSLLDSCQVLNEEGKSYILTKDLELLNEALINKKCFIVEADSITLDFDGHIITFLEDPPLVFGYDFDYNAISINNYDNFILKNGLVDSSSRPVSFKNTNNSEIINFQCINSFNSGFYFDRVTYSSFYNLVSDSSLLEGILISLSHNNTFDSVNLLNNGVGGGKGMWIYSSKDNTFNGLNVNGNFGGGISLSSNSNITINSGNLENNGGNFDLDIFSNSKVTVDIDQVDVGRVDVRDGGEYIEV